MVDPWRLGEPVARLTGAVTDYATSIPLDVEWTWETPWAAIDGLTSQAEIVKLSGLPEGLSAPVLRGADGGPALAHDVGAKLYPAWPTSGTPWL